MQIVAINKRIAPEGRITKTHLYINWPELKQDDEYGYWPAEHLLLPYINAQKH